ncbi:uncharacterized protein E0L32_010178 [Thyridium curvatum]|uniref:FAD-binding FR-type domain-containing protein n=1 Tax=Thyridium curvatum TaxID=1093900 RepID=A0A507AT73_9PEZI|nr:uncharacterized protein E0L32_010178 [Thyridium curvatum]TPX08111.1 hypothetical protein E0L32_010178 [Thyridium curvatum]
MVTPSSPDRGRSVALAHVSSHRMTSSISLHTFSAPVQLPIRPTQHVVIQFPPDLDPIGGAHSLKEDDRRLQFTPCRISVEPMQGTADGARTTLAFFSRNGRVTSLIGLPRPQGLGAQLVEVGGGFSEEVLESPAQTIAVAGGTGISCFLSLESSNLGEDAATMRRILAWSIRGEDFPLVEYVLQNGMLDIELWDVKIFVTAGEDPGGLVGGKPETVWKDRFNSIKQNFQGVEFACRRMEKSDIFEDSADKKALVLFCGSKSLQWQIKMWALGIGTVHVTDR